MHQLAQGDFQEAILTLEPVARRLEQAGKDKDLARTEFYLGIALLELNRQGTAKERFLKALELDSSLRVPGAAFAQDHELLRHRARGRPEEAVGPPLEGPLC